MANNEQYNDWLKARARPRAMRAAALRAKGKTWAEIGKALGVTRQRATALVASHQEAKPRGK